MWTWLYRRFVPDQNSQVTVTVRDLISGGMELFDSENPYPIWNEKHRSELNDKILEHYMFRQIGFETAARFKFELNKKMREIMPYYNKIWKTTLYDYNPIENYNMEETSKDTSAETTDENSKLSENGSTSDTSKHSDTPQGTIDRIDKYMSDATKTDGSHISESDAERFQTRDSSLDHTAARHGNIGVTSTQQLIEMERKVTIDVDMMIVNDLGDLFLGIW